MLLAVSHGHVLMASSSRGGLLLLFLALLSSLLLYGDLQPGVCKPADDCLLPTRRPYSLLPTSELWEQGNIASFAVWEDLLVGANQILGLSS